jgi:hypothetical protein
LTWPKVLLGINLELRMGDYPIWISAVANCVMAVGVFLVMWQIRLSKRMATTQFEDGMAKEYRELAAKIPTKALLGEDLTEDEYKETFDEFYHYIDLSNEEAFLWKRKRVTKATWNFWLEGIKWNLSRAAFKRAWMEIKEKDKESFQELRALEENGFRKF